VRKSGRGPLFSCFIAFLFYNFSKSFEGVHEVPPSSPLSPLCAIMLVTLNIISVSFQLNYFSTVILTHWQ
jgi:hypothetical protein